MVWTLNLFISPWQSSLLSLVAVALLLVGLFSIWLSGRSLNTMLGEKNATVESRLLRSQRALQALRTAGLRLCLAFSLGILVGWGIHDIHEFHNTFVLTNAVVDSQNGDYVTYHFEDDPTREPYALNFTCSNYKPHFKPRQIIAKMTYTRKGDCESLDGPQYVVKLRRINGVPTLEGE